MNTSTQLPLWTSHSGIISKNICPQKHPSRFIFPYRCSELVAKFLEKYCNTAHFLVNLHVTLCCFWPLAQKKDILSHHFAEQLVLWNTSRKLFLCCENLGGGEFRGTSGIIRRWIESSSLKETSTGRLMNKKVKSFWHTAVKEKNK